MTFPNLMSSVESLLVMTAHDLFLTTSLETQILWLLKSMAFNDIIKVCFLSPFILYTGHSQKLSTTSVTRKRKVKTFQIIAQSIFLSRSICCAYVSVKFGGFFSLFDFDLAQVEKAIEGNNIRSIHNM